MTTNLVSIPRLPIPIHDFTIRRSIDRVEFILTDERVVSMPATQWRMIQSFFDAAYDYAILAGYDNFTEYRDQLRFTTVFVFWKHY